MAQRGDILQTMSEAPTEAQDSPTTTVMINWIKKLLGIERKSTVVDGTWSELLKPGLAKNFIDAYDNERN